VSRGLPASNGRRRPEAHTHIHEVRSSRCALAANDS
jgi:hypothetical protein